MPATILEFASRRGGKTALQWHVLKQHSHLLGMPIVCATCERPHQVPPTFGRCGCGSYCFAVHSAQQPQLPLALDFHGGEQ